MSKIYTPNNWQIIHGQPKDKTKGYYRIIAGWSGSYMYGTSWKVSSGCEQVFDLGDSWKVTQSSGSVYNLSKSSEYSSVATAGVLEALQEHYLACDITVVKMENILKNFGIYL
jgi:hypothetical protein